MYYADVRDAAGVLVASFGAHNLTQLEIIARGAAETHFLDKWQLRGNKDKIKKTSFLRVRKGVKTIKLSYKGELQKIEEPFTLNYERI